MLLMKVSGVCYIQDLFNNAKWTLGKILAAFIFQLAYSMYFLWVRGKVLHSSKRTKLSFPIVVKSLKPMDMNFIWLMYFGP